MMKQLIGIVGYKGSGKTTAARALSDIYPGVYMYAFAQPIKHMLSIGFGVNPEEKAAPLYPGSNVTVGMALQTLGTEWGRNLVGKNVWVDIAEKAYTDMSDGGTMIIHDVRFLSEADFIRRAGGVLIRVLGNHGLPDGRDNKHQSELEQDEIVCDLSIANTCALDLFAERVVAEVPAINKLLVARR